MRNDELEDIFEEDNDEEIDKLFTEEDDSSRKSSPQVQNKINNNPILNDKINNLIKHKLPVSNLGNIVNKINSNNRKIQVNTTSEEEQTDSIQEKQNGILSVGSQLLGSKTVASQQPDDTLKKELTHIVMNKILTQKVAVAIGIVILIVVLLIIFVIIATTVKDDESEINTSNEVIGVVTGKMNYEEITDYLVYMGICRELTDKNEEQKACMESGFGKFILEFKDVYEEYKQYLDKDGNPIELDVPLIMETISYNRSDNTLVELLNTTSGLGSVKNELYELAQAQVEYIQEVGDYYNSSCKKTKNKEIGEPYYRISDDKYVSYLKYGKVHENYSGNAKIYDAVIHPDSEEECIPDGKSYSPPSTTRYVGETIIEENNGDTSDNNSNSNENTVTGNGIGVQVANYALQFVGNPYVWGGTSLTDGIDCSGFTMKIFEHFGISLPHYSISQAKYGKDIGTNISNAIPGDLIVYNHSHVAIYIGNNKIVHAASSKSGIKIGNKADYKSILSIRRLVE